MKRALVVGMFLGLAVGLGWFLWPKVRLTDQLGSTAPVASDRLVDGTLDAGGSQVAPIASLNSPSHTALDDLRLLQDVFVQWQTNFAATGNPVGTNAEITAALTGGNDLQLDLIPRDHPAINARGELGDRWGTPFRFHQRSGTEMQIISAGPDRDFATADDVTAP